MVAVGLQAAPQPLVGWPPPGPFQPVLITYVLRSVTK